MKNIKKISLFFCVCSMTVLLWNCAKADKEFVHDSNIISQMICKAAHGSSEFRGVISEFDKNGNPLADKFEQKDAEGGYGIIMFEISKSLQDDVNLENIYLVATLTWDQSITPSLSGRHNITGDGIVITVKSGVGSERQYRIRGIYK